MPDTSTRTEDPAFLESVRRDVQTGLIDLLDPEDGVGSVEGELRDRCQNRVEKLANRFGQKLSPEMKAEIVRGVIADAFGLGPLDELLKDDEVTDVLVNGPDRIFVERHGRITRSAASFRDQAHLLHIVQRLVRRSGRRLDERSPMVDARLPDGSRVNIIIPPLALEGPQLSIRRFARTPLDLDRLVEYGSLAAETATLLAAAVASRMNIAITGGAGSGKTTLLNALSGHVGSDERVITIEDAAELRLVGDHVVRLETRAANLEGVGEVDASALVRNALRMRPDRIIVGECRGAEAFDMLQAMNTGHEGSMTTLHANSSRDALIRLESMLTMSGFEAPIAVLREYLGSALDMVVHIDRLPGGRRVVSGVSELRMDEDRSVELHELHRFELLGVENGEGYGEFRATGESPSFMGRAAARGHDIDPGLFEKSVLATVERRTS